MHQIGEPSGGFHSLCGSTFYKTVDSFTAGSSCGERSSALNRQEHYPLRPNFGDLDGSNGGMTLSLFGLLLLHYFASLFLRRGSGHRDTSLDKKLEPYEFLDLRRTRTIVGVYTAKRMPCQLRRIEKRDFHILTVQNLGRTYVATCTSGARSALSALDIASGSCAQPGSPDNSRSILGSATARGTNQPSATSASFSRNAHPSISLPE